MKRLVPVLTLCLIAATAAHAQGGGGGGGRRGGEGGRGGGGAPPTSGPPAGATGAPRRAELPTDKIFIVGVVTAIDAASDRVTIACEANETLNLPAGTRPFVAAKSALLKDVTVGEKVRFSLESQQISVLAPF